MDSAEEDSADMIKGYDPEAGKWVVAKRVKSNKPSKVRRREVEPVDTKSEKYDASQMKTVKMRKPQR